MAGALKDISIETVKDMLGKYKKDPKELDFVKNSLIKGGCPRSRIDQAEKEMWAEKKVVKPIVVPISKPMIKTEKVSIEHHFPKKLVIGIAAIIVTILVVVIIFINSPKDCGNDEQCFIQHANLCEKVKLTNFIAQAEFVYTANGCELKKTVIQLDKNEQKEVRNKFEGKSMVCTYGKYNFNPAYLKEIAGGISSCKGELADEILGVK